MVVLDGSCSLDQLMLALQRRGRGKGVKRLQRPYWAKFVHRSSRKGGRNTRPKSDEGSFLIQNVSILYIRLINPIDLITKAGCLTQRCILLVVAKP